MWPKTFHKPQRDRNPQGTRVRIVSEPSRKFRVVVPLPQTPVLAQKGGIEVRATERT